MIVFTMVPEYNPTTINDKLTIPVMINMEIGASAIVTAAGPW